MALLAIAPMMVVPVLAAAGAGTTEAAGASEVEAAFAARTTAERQSGGIPALVVEDDLVTVARRHSAAMAAENRLYHNPALAEQVQGWQLVGENVGTGASVEEVHVALMASPQHRSEILDPRFTGVGIGVVQAGDVIWVTEVFRRRPPPPPPVPPAATTPDATAVASAPPLRPARAARAAPVTTASIGAVTTTTTAVPITTTTTTTTTTTAVAPPPVVALEPVAVAASSTLPVTPGLVDAGILAAALLWMVVVGLARVTIPLQPRSA